MSWPHHNAAKSRWNSRAGRSGPALTAALGGAMDGAAARDDLAVHRLDPVGDTRPGELERARAPACGERAALVGVVHEGGELPRERAAVAGRDHEAVDV